jgi:hypothetical protein
MITNLNSTILIKLWISELLKLKCRVFPRISNDDACCTSPHEGPWSQVAEGSARECQAAEGNGPCPDGLGRGSFIRSLARQLLSTALALPLYVAPNHTLAPPRQLIDTPDCRTASSHPCGRRFPRSSRTEMREDLTGDVEAGPAGLDCSLSDLGESPVLEHVACRVLPPSMRQRIPVP